jgi:hypothetical protein
MIIYLLIGLSVSILFDWVMKKMPIEELQFTNWERLVIITIWPLAILWAIYGFLKNKNNNDKGN